MGKNWEKLPSFIDQIKKFDFPQISSILNDVFEEMLKYYSGFACELCHPRTVEAVDIEEDA